MTMYNFRHVAYSESSPYSALHFSSSGCFSIFQLIVLVFQPSTLLFWFILIAQAAVFSFNQTVD